MAGFDAATAIHGGDGSYKAEIDGDWCVWSPAGGYLAAIALRAAGRQSGFPTPLSLSCHFLSAHGLPAVEHFESLDEGRIAEAFPVIIKPRLGSASQGVQGCFL